MAIVRALKVIDCEDHTREVTKDDLGYYIAAVGAAGTGKTTTIRQRIYCLLSFDDIRNSFHQLARSLARRETQDKNVIEIEDTVL